MDGPCRLTLLVHTAREKERATWRLGEEQRSSAHFLEFSPRSPRCELPSSPPPSYFSQLRSAVIYSESVTAERLLYSGGNIHVFLRPQPKLHVSVAATRLKQCIHWGKRSRRYISMAIDVRSADFAMAVGGRARLPARRNATEVLVERPSRARARTWPSSFVP